MMSFLDSELFEVASQRRNLIRRDSRSHLNNYVLGGVEKLR